MSSFEGVGTIKHVVSQLNKLYLRHGQRSKYLLQSRDFGYMTIDRSKGRHSPFLNDGHMKAHLEGRHTVGIFANYRDESGFMTFDIDIADDWGRVKDVGNRIMKVFESLEIDRRSVLPSFSGNKGAHIDIFFSEPVKVDILKRLYWYVLHESGLADMSDIIEFRPTQSQGVKIPAGFHMKTMRSCHLLNPDDMDETLNVDYLDRVDVLDATAFVEMVKGLPSLETVKHEAVSLAPGQIDSHGVGYDENITAKSLEKVLVEGFPAYGTRHNYSFRLALLFRYKYGYTKADTLDVLKAFLRNNQNTYSTPFDEAIQDTERIVHDIFEGDNDYKLTLDTVKHVEFIDAELWSVVTATDSNGKAFTPNRKKVLFAMLAHWKRHGELNEFFMTYSQMSQGSGVSNRRMLKEATEALQAAGYIDIVRRNHRNDGSMKHEANIYRLIFDIKKEGIPSGKRKSFKVEKLSSHSFNRTIGKAFTKKQLRRHLPRRQLESLHG